MEKTPMISRSCNNHHQLWFAILISFLLCSLLVLCFDYSHTFQTPNNILNFSLNKKPNTFVSDSCTGRYVFIQNLPSRFNQYLLQNCQFLTRGTDKPNMCPYMDNMGLGPEVKNQNFKDILVPNNTWYATNQFLLEVIFHNRMKSYECLTNDSSLASAVFVPSYIGLDISRFLWVNNLTVRDSSGFELVNWLVEKPEWKKMWGRDHFLISGRISWDFRRQFDDLAYWGSKFRFLPQSMNMSMLAVEGSSWNNDYAIPYPTSFHPSMDNDVLQWQSKIRHQKREFLFTFTGAPRPENEDSIRGKIIEQCRGSRFCKFIDCSYGGEKCDDPVNVMKVFGNSVFSLQPSGDSYTRRSIFDSILAGCIPVFFHPGTAYSQYKWHLPRNRTKYSVYIPVKDVKEWNVDLEKVLLEIPEKEVIAMREEVIKLIPKIVYADPRSKLDNFEDAFDLALKGMLERIENVRETMRKGKDPSVGFADEDHYKYTFN
ncbi:putative exostosin [Medicago truncatula]|uniref:Putative exostosin n=1 Tax=Medicago truncatula TaxID=3880 RepID=G7JAS7_MEDTR|nr:probable xyloglucan galactosyltransferase GT14 [Medicago truncatula]AES71944.1 xyloglucan galactosyltransferase KATAMARI-like protein [Medicago truncatula]RHN69178.1 putative exostosin [Medicago truncatula]